jgi:hypothetical protein
MITVILSTIGLIVVCGLIGAGAMHLYTNVTIKRGKRR